MKGHVENHKRMSRIEVMRNVMRKVAKERNHKRKKNHNEIIKENYKKKMLLNRFINIILYGVSRIAIPNI